MLELLDKTIKLIVSYGIGQSILAFSSWGYIFILLVAVVYYTIVYLITKARHTGSKKT